MKTVAPPTAFTVTVYTRHTADCPKRDNRYWKRCKCRKALYIYEKGRDRKVSAKTRSWEQAERLAQFERDRRDPAKRLLQKIKEQEVQKLSLQQEKNITVVDASERWYATKRFKTSKTSSIYGRAARRIKTWAKDQGIVNLAEVTPAKLEQWKSAWRKDSEKVYNRLGQTSQAQFLDYLKQFFLWTSRMEFVAVDPSRFLESIPKNKERIRPLSAQQFEELLEGVDAFTSASAGQVQGWAAELKALFLFQRWAGLRILDCLMFPRAGLVGNRISLVTKKTGAKIENRAIPDHMAEALRALSPDRPGWRRDYFFWPEGRKSERLTSQFGDIIGDLNAFLAFTDEEGMPMRFHSHQLRDTYAVELLLAGVLLEDVSKLLTHSSIQTTERHYAPWVKSRLQQLEDKSVEAMRRMGVKVGGK